MQLSKETILKLETIYYKVKIYFKIDSNNCKIWWIFIFTLNMSWLYHFNYNLKSLIHVSSQNTFGQIFHSNQHKCVEKNHFWKIIFIENIIRIMFEAFVSKSILYVYLYIDIHLWWNQIKTTPKIIQKIPFKKHFLVQGNLLQVCFHPCGGPNWVSSWKCHAQILCVDITNLPCNKT